MYSVIIISCLSFAAGFGFYWLLHVAGEKPPVSGSEVYKRKFDS